MNLPKFKCGEKQTTELDVYVTTEDIDPAKILHASIDLLEKMRGSNASPTEKTIIAMPKYRSKLGIIIHF